MTDCHVEKFPHMRNVKKMYHIEKVLHMTNVEQNVLRGEMCYVEKCGEMSSKPVMWRNFSTRAMQNVENIWHVEKFLL